MSVYPCKDCGKPYACYGFNYTDHRTMAKRTVWACPNCRDNVKARWLAYKDAGLSKGRSDRQEKPSGGGNAVQGSLDL